MGKMYKYSFKQNSSLKSFMQNNLDFNQSEFTYFQVSNFVKFILILTFYLICDHLGCEQTTVLYRGEKLI